MNRVLVSIGGITIYWYSFLIFMSILIGLYLVKKEVVKTKIDKDFIFDLIFYLIPICIFGARIYYVVFNFKIFKNNLIDIFKIWEGGLAIYGGVLAGLIFTFFYCKKKHQNILTTLDILAPCLILGQAIGRWGNFFNSEAHGATTTLTHLKSLHIPNFIITGFEEMIIENYKGILEYEDYYVRVNTYIGIVNIHGINLRLEKMTEDNIKIIGKIESIEIERTIDS